MTAKDYLEKIKSQNLPVIINGASIVGEVLYDFLSENGIKIECFCDGSIRTSKEKFLGFEVIHTSKLKDKFDDALIIISAAAIKDVVDLLEEMKFNNWIAGGELLRGFNIVQDKKDFSIDYQKFAIDNCILCHDGFIDSDKLFMRSIDLIITEKCSLRCKDCSNLMQYYQAPQNVDTNILLKSIDNYCSIIDEVMDFRVIGGETFMNRNWHIIVDRLIKEPKARRIVLYTNGTILPSKNQIKYLQNEKVLIIATNYGDHLSRKIDDLREVCKKNGILYHILEIEDWLDCAAINQHNRTDKKNIEIFKLCCAKNMATLSDGKVFRCPYAANAHRLSAVPDFQEDYIDIFAQLEKGKSVTEIKSELKNYLLNKNFLKICDFCNGRPLSGKEITPAIQTQKAIAYKKFVN